MGLKVQEVVGEIAEGRSHTLESVAHALVRFGEDAEDVMGVLLRGDLGPCTDLVAYLDVVLDLNESEQSAITSSIREDALALARREGWIEEGEKIILLENKASWPRDLGGKAYRSTMVVVYPQLLWLTLLAYSNYGAGS